MFDSLKWKLRRLGVMSFHEIAHRTGHAAKILLERSGFFFARPPVAQGASGSPWGSTSPSIPDVAIYVAAGDQILAGKFDVFTMRNAALGFPPNWNQDPKTLRVAPLVFGKTLNYRDENIVGDIKYLWEPNRHLGLVTLAQAWRLTGDIKYSNGCRTLLESWFDQCPYPLGVNWVSSLEHSVRLVNWSFAWHILGGDSSPLFSSPDGQSFKKRWLDSIYQHCHFISGHYSKYSSANNHILGEYMGLFVGSLTWPLWPESSVWQHVAQHGFESEALLQNCSDGVNREQAFYYHHEVMDMMVICGLIGRANGVEMDPEYWSRLDSMMSFLASVMDSAGNVPMVGDADDALMVRLSQELGWSHYRSLLASGAVIFKRGDLAAKAGCFDDKSRWLLGDSAAHEFASLSLPPDEQPRMIFSEGGYFLMGARFGNQDEVRALVDCGPLGYLSIAAHGHADALAMVLSAGGREFLIDPGTYAYHTQKKWRNYFRSTAAHNTVRVDGLDQSEIGGDFLWLRKAKAHCTVTQTGADVQRFSGWHDGYDCLPDPVRHQRDINFDASINCFEVTDYLRCRGHHEVELFWHFAEQCKIVVAPTQVLVYSANVCLTMTMTGLEVEPVALFAQEEPPSGWISRSFDSKIGTSTLVWRVKINGDARLITKISISFEPTSH